MKIFNIGVTCVLQDGLDNIGFHVMAQDADTAYARVRARCEALDIVLTEGHTAQRRDPNGGNEYFDRTYPLFHALDEILI